MTFEQITTILSLLTSILAIIFSHLGAKLHLNYNIKKDKNKVFHDERNLCAEFLGYCKKAKHFGLTNDELRFFMEIYAKLYTIHHKELRNALVEYCDSVITKKEQNDEKFSLCLQLFEKSFNDNLF